MGNAPPEPLMLAEELARYPHTGRFLMGRLRGEMSAEERGDLEGMIERTEWIDRPTRIIERGQRLEHSTILIDGYMLRTLEDEGRRHAVSLHVPGDFVDLHCFALKRLDHNIDTVGQVKVGYVPHRILEQVLHEKPHLTRLLWFSTLLDAAIHREWITALEQLTTPRRIAHIMAETSRRLWMVGLGQPDGFDTPLTQANLSEMCGTSPIHINRAIRDLRQQNIGDFDRGRITIPDRQLLEEYAHFTPDYLYGPWSLAYDSARDPDRAAIVQNAGS